MNSTYSCFQSLRGEIFHVVAIVFAICELRPLNVLKRALLILPGSGLFIRGDDRPPSAPC
jgi:hypothetical protein